MRESVVRVASVTAFELRWPAMGPEVALLGEIAARLRIEAFDAVAQERAVDIARRCIDRKFFCARCWTPTNAKPCPECKAVGSKWRRLNDVYIAASAIAAGDVTTLYTYDESFKHYLEGSSVAAAEPPESMPLHRHALEKSIEGDPDEKKSSG